MTKEIRSPNVQMLRVVRSLVLSFGFGHSFGFRHSSFGFENHGSWVAPFRFSACIGTMNRSDSDRGRSPPAAVAQRRERGSFSKSAGAGHTLRPGTGRGPLA